ncbi:CHRD domain-containing protein [Cupriavidus sp. USMAA2-4]|uniref:CHRD domain-containing protein n=1 Tax=Cupriavidus sp. USMAA2-4 TaxID=876364 RepID=UPI0008A6F9EE|nr:CHRD domain-containing protein [Cupriavidus sp. USMAA2-4]AOY95409.1 CHRD domain-containing protein [Cupriavidus sp. USMAA2-4]
MGASQLRRALVGLSGLALAGSMALVQAAPVSFTVALSGTQEVPPVQTKGSGSANLTFDPGTRVVTWTITLSDLSSEPTMAHFHGPATPGKNADVKVWISRKDAALTSPLQGQATLSPADAQELLTGEMYINVHTKAHPAGEIRGQVLPPKGP